MKNICKKILSILPILIFIGMMSYSVPARAGLLGSVEAWVSEKWDTATTIGQAALNVARSGGDRNAVMDAVGTAAAAALGLLPAHDCPSPILERNERPCMFCQMFRVIYMACSGVARTTYELFHSPIGTLILVFMGVSLALIVLKNVVAMGTRDPGNIANELFTKGFVCVAIYFILTEDYFNILNLTINSIVADGMAFASMVSDYDSDYTINLGGSHIYMGAEGGSAFSASIGQLLIDGINHIERKINVLFQYGSYAFCLGTGPERIFKLLPNPVFLIDGIILYIGGLLFLIGYPWVLADALIQMGVAMALLPFTLAGYAFTGTKNFLGKTFSWILHAIFVFIFMGILISCILDFVSKEFIDKIFINNMEAHRFFTDPINGIAFYGVNMLKIVFILFLGWIYMPLTRDLASKFSKGSSLTAAAMTGKAVTNAVQQNLQRAGSWAGNATVSATKNAVKSMSKKTGRGAMVNITNWFGHDDGSGNKTFTVGGRFMPKTLTRGLEFKVEKDSDGNKILRREFTSVTGRKHVMLSDKYTTIKEEYTASGRLVKRDATFKKDFMNHLMDKKGKMNVDAMKAIYDSPLGKNAAYRQIIAERIATNVLKSKGKDLGTYFKDRTVTFDPSNPYRIQIIQTDHNDRKTNITLDINSDTGQTAVSYASNFKHRDFSIGKKGEVDFYFNNGVVEIQTNAKRDTDGSLLQEVTKFNYSAAAQKGHDSILVDGSNPIVDATTGAIASDLQPVVGGRPNPLNLTHGMNGILGGTYITGLTVSDFLVQNILKEGSARHTNKFTTNISQYFI